MKAKVIAAILKNLRSEHEQLSRAAAAAHDAATNEESKPENQYDTRALEASYLASAQKQRVSALDFSIRTLEELPLSKVSAAGPGTLLEVNVEDQTRWFFFYPLAAGVVVEVEGRRISVIGQESPVGKALLGKSAGDSVEISGPAGKKEYEIVSLQ